MRSRRIIVNYFAKSSVPLHKILVDTFANFKLLLQIMFMFFLLSDDKVSAVFTVIYFSEECTITNTKAPKIF